MAGAQSAESPTTANTKKLSGKCIFIVKTRKNVSRSEAPEKQGKSDLTNRQEDGQTKMEHFRNY